MLSRRSKEPTANAMSENDDEILGVGEVVNGEEEGEEDGGIRIGDIYLPPPPPPACTFDSTGPRLIITHIENDFFKSYAGKQVLGPFHKSFTSIVGPNGSGKSNVIDSMLFVFGYRAQKIRSKKMSVLIHNSEQHPNVHSCTVSVFFEKIIDIGSDNFDVVPDSKFCISRIAFRDNSSFYKIDGKRCQFRAVSKLLRNEGIDLDHNRFLILQGEVEQIALMRPKAQTEHDTGMLEYLEDIVGSTRFKEPIELLSKRLEELNELRGEKLNRVKLVEKEKDELEEPKNEAVSYLKLENDIARRKNMLYQRFILDCSRNKEKAEVKKKEVDERMSDIKEKLGKMENLRKEKDAEAAERKLKLESILKSKEGLHERFKALESEDVKLQEDLKHKNQKRKKLMVQSKNDREKFLELEKVPEKSQKDIEECETRRETLEKSRREEEEAYHEAMASLNSETQQLQDEKEKFETKLVDLRREVDETRSALNIAQSELDIYLSTEKNEAKKLEQIKASLEKVNSDLSSRKIEINDLKVNIPKFENVLKNNQKTLQHLIPKLSVMEEELKATRVRLEETRSSMQATKSRGRVLDAIMEQKVNGNIPGIYGRLGDLGGIDEKYDIAISTACGPLDNIVVDCVDTGQKCINFLKRNNIGTATFIALDKMERWRSNAQNKISTPENVSRLFDLIRVNDETILTAFYFSIRDTLVTDDLDQASRIAYGRVRHRVVTLKGELIEPSGTMSGGGKSVVKGRMGKSASVITVDPKEVSFTEHRVEELTRTVGELRREKVKLEDEMQSSQRDLEKMRMNLQKYSMEIDAFHLQEKTLKVQLSEQLEKVASVKPEKSRVVEMEKNINAKQKDHTTAASAAVKIETEVNKIHAQIMEITGGRIKGLKKKLDTTNKKLEQINAEITRLQVLIKTAKRNYKKMEEKIAGLEMEIKEVETDLLGFKDRKQAIEEEAAGILENMNAITHEESQIEDELVDLRKSLEEVSVKENEIKSSKIEFDQEIERYDGVIKENKSKISHWKKELNHLELHEIFVRGREDEEERDSVATELKTLDEDELEKVDPKNLQLELNVLEEKLRQSRPNLSVLQEYKKKEELYLQRVSELDEITQRRDEQRRYHEDLRKQRLNEFMSGFTIISNKLKEMYQMITLGGDAELELVDSLDPFSEGIIFSVRPPKKSWKNITNLSGGEKTLSSLALVFALHYYKPTPLYVMDEIDAALDFKNVSIVGNYIKERTKNAQFIIISLRSQMFELADRLVGIFKVHNCTKSVTINPSKYSINVSRPKDKEPMAAKQVLRQTKTLTSDHQTDKI